MAAKNAVDLDGDVPQNRIAGHVVDENGQPIPRAYVSAVLSGGRNIFFEVIADSGGHFDFLAVDRGEYTVRATSPDSHFESGRSGVSVRSGTMDVRLALTGAAITGRVLFDGKPMPYFGLSLHQRDIFTGGRMAIRDADGQFTLGHLEPGTWQLTLVGPGTRMKRFDQITIESGRPVDVGDVVLEPGQRIRGRVRDRSGAPVSGARVIIGDRPTRYEAPAQHDRWFQGPCETTTDATGAYALDGVELRPELVGPQHIWATHPTSGVSVIRALREGDETIDIELLGSGHIEGVVEGARGGVPVVLARRADEPGGVRRTIVTKSSDVRYVAEFRFDDVPPGAYVISLQVPERVGTSPVHVTVVDGQSVPAKLAMVTSGVCLTVTIPAGRGRSLVLASADDSTPEPEQGPRFVIGETRITTMKDHSPPPSEREGVVFQYLQPGHYRATVDGEAWTPIVVGSRPEEQRVEIALPE
jgi:Carboxypeptidase regulatory-like domain